MKSIQRRLVPLFVLLLIAAVSAPVFAHEQSAGQLEFKHLWIKQVPGARNGAMFVEIINQGDTDDHLIAVRTDMAKKAQLHTQVIEDGIARMRRIDGIDIPAGGTVRLEPGGMHIMLMGIQGMQMDGAMVPVTLVFEAAGKISLTAAIEGMMQGMDEHETHQDGMNGDDMHHDMHDDMQGEMHDEMQGEMNGDSHHDDH